MGTFNWPLRISSMDGQPAQDIEATLDTGAAYTTLPASLLRELGVERAGLCQRAIPALHTDAPGPGGRARRG